MKSPVPPFLERIQAETKASREKLAGELFELDTVRGLVIAAAGEGFSKIIIRPPRPIDLRDTNAARAAVKHLTDSGLKPFWESYIADSNGHQVAASELHVEWV